MGKQEKQPIDQQRKARRPALSYLVGPGIPESDKQRVYHAPGQEPPQIIQPLAAEPAEPPAPESTLEADEQPPPLRQPAAPKAPPTPAPAQTGQSAPRKKWQPPSTEEIVGKFLNEVAEMAPPPPPVQQRQESDPPLFYPMLSAPAESASRKKVNTTPFLLEIQSAAPVTDVRPKRPRKRGMSQHRRRIIRMAVIVGALVLIVLVALAFVLLRH